MKINNLEKSVYNLIKKSAVDLPEDVELAIKRQLKSETNKNALFNLNCILENVKVARAKSTPICQDTGFLNFFITLKNQNNQNSFNTAIKKAVIQATKDGFLRPNIIDIATNKNTNNNLGISSPNIYFENGKTNEIRLLLKGGGSENASCQFSLPSTELDAGRDLNGIEKCVLHALCEIQGKGCAPGILGISIGGDRASGYCFAKKQLLRKLNDKGLNSEFEKRLLDKANKLQIGPMGLGGKTTLFGCKVVFLDRHIATYYVTIAYMCWANRRHGFILKDDGSILKWLY